MRFIWSGKFTLYACAVTVQHSEAAAEAVWSFSLLLENVTVSTGKVEMEGMSTKDVSMMLRDDFPEETIENLKLE